MPKVGEDPWTLLPSGKRPEKIIAGPFPPSARVTVANLVYVAKEGLPPALLSRLWRLAAFQNPEFYHAQALRLSTFGKPRVISCTEEFERHIGLPRGCLDDTREVLEAHGIRIEMVDERAPGTPIDIAFHGELTPIQRKAADAVLAHDIGVLCAPTAFGKTVVAAWLITARRVNTLVLVHRRHLLDQWQARLIAFLELPVTAIGQIGGGKHEPGGRIDIALIQSLSNRESVDDIVAQYGQVIVDECHHIPASSFERVLKAVKARFVVGLTATPIRKDGHHPIVLMQCGPLRFRVSPRDEAAARPFEQVVIPRPTGFRLPDGVDGSGIQGVYAALAADERRNDLICDDLLRVLEEGRTPLLLTERTAHLDELARRLEGKVRHLVVLRGGMGARKRRAVAAQLEAIPEGEPWALLATGRYAGEGFDNAQLDTLLLALPVSWRGTVQQYAGRLNRLHPEKRDVRVYDYLDAGIPVLARMYDKRRKGYRALGYVIQPTEDHDPQPDVSQAQFIEMRQFELNQGRQ
jgi:superfamily II DNA or RNA helicase